MFLKERGRKKITSTDTFYATTHTKNQLRVLDEEMAVEVEMKVEGKEAVVMIAAVMIAVVMVVVVVVVVVVVDIAVVNEK